MTESSFVLKYRNSSFATSKKCVDGSKLNIRLITTDPITEKKTRKVVKSTTKSCSDNDEFIQQSNIENHSVTQKPSNVVMISPSQNCTYAKHRKVNTPENASFGQKKSRIVISAIENCINNTESNKKNNVAENPLHVQEKSRIVVNTTIKNCIDNAESIEKINVVENPSLTQVSMILMNTNIKNIGNNAKSIAKGNIIENYSLIPENSAMQVIKPLKNSANHVKPIKNVSIAENISLTESNLAMVASMATQSCTNNSEPTGEVNITESSLTKKNAQKLLVSAMRGSNSKYSIRVNSSNKGKLKPFVLVIKRNLRDQGKLKNLRVSELNEICANNLKESRKHISVEKATAQKKTHVGEGLLYKKSCIVNTKIHTQGKTAEGDTMAACKEKNCTNTNYSDLCSVTTPLENSGQKDVSKHSDYDCEPLCIVSGDKKAINDVDESNVVLNETNDDLCRTCLKKGTIPILTNQNRDLLDAKSVTKVDKMENSLQIPENSTMQVIKPIQSCASYVEPIKNVSLAENLPLTDVNSAMVAATPTKSCTNYSEPISKLNITENSLTKRTPQKLLVSAIKGSKSKYSIRVNSSNKGKLKPFVLVIKRNLKNRGKLKNIEISKVNKSYANNLKESRKHISVDNSTDQKKLHLGKGLLYKKSCTVNTKIHTQQNRADSETIAACKEKNYTNTNYIDLCSVTTPLENSGQKDVSRHSDYDCEPLCIESGDKKAINDVDESDIILNETNDDLCRICLKKGTIPIFTDQNKDMLDSIMTFGSIKISEVDNYPKCICVFCRLLLQNAIIFRKKAQISDKKLREVETDHGPGSNDDGMSKVGVCIYNDINDNNKEKSAQDDHLPLQAESEVLSQSREAKTEVTNSYIEVEPEFPNLDTSHIDESTSAEEDPPDDNFIEPKLKKVTNLICQQCGAQYHGWKKFTDHIKDNHPETIRLLCPICQKPCTVSRIEQHLLYHDGFVCDICGKFMMDPTNFKDHCRTHTTEFPFKCSLCLYRAKHRGSLRIHKRTHTGDRPYKCPQCPETFLSTGNLQRHIYKHRGMRPFRCETCNMAYLGKSDLQRHIRSVHFGIKTYSQCKFCDESFSTPKLYYEHRRQVHNLNKLPPNAPPRYLIHDMMNTSVKCTT